jgi:hypothetical protein
MSDFVQQQGQICDFKTSDSWVILSPIEQSIKRKIESVGTPLKDWDINIYRGVLTGYNDAFIITTEKRDEILANCATPEERERTAELIRPILRGRDIKRYGYEWAGLWLINTHNGVKGKFPRIDINDYPAIKAHLDQYWDKIEKRADQGDTPYNLRNCAYVEDFSKPKIVWGEISDKPKFAFDFSGKYTPEATSFYMNGEQIEYLFGVLNSYVSEWLFSKVGTTTGVGTIRWKKYTIEKLVVARPTQTQSIEYLHQFNNYKNKIISLEDFQEYCNNLMYTIYLFNNEEINVIKSFIGC